ncbi:transposase [Mesorhizobium sp. M0047]|uniref:IS66-like element accessory protein TnpA n=1 Tax=Mesorhizobium sp. M0047 TaxID=2956859 RepID=UPI00333BEE4C
MRVEILGAERRRRWGDKKKLDIVMSVGIEGATVTEVAERHDVTRQQIYTWRRELRRKGLLLPSAGPMFLPMDMPVARSELYMGKGTDRLSASLVELQLCCGRNLRFDREIDTATLTRLIQAVEIA